ncbi:MAG: hypothetical protein RL204_1372 [Bacteroidota bacterium]|jgi:hypothetical protein
MNVIGIVVSFLKSPLRLMMDSISEEKMRWGSALVVFLFCYVLAFIPLVYEVENITLEVLWVTTLMFLTFTVPYAFVLAGLSQLFFRAHISFQANLVVSILMMCCAFIIAFIGLMIRPLMDDISSGMGPVILVSCFFLVLVLLRFVFNLRYYKEKVVSIVLKSCFEFFLSQILGGIISTRFLRMIDAIYGNG